ncbi:hypothetical protein D9M69_496440 [compost metagenome]
MRGQPFLGLLDLRQRMAGHRAVGVAQHQAAVPVDLERVLDDAAGFVLTAQRGKVARGGLGDARGAALVGGQRAPEFAEGVGIVAALVEHGLDRHLLEPQRQHRMQRVALLQRARQAQYL